MALLEWPLFLLSDWDEYRRAKGGDSCLGQAAVWLGSQGR